MSGYWLLIDCSLPGKRSKETVWAIHTARTWPSRMPAISTYPNQPGSAYRVGFGGGSSGIASASNNEGHSEIAKADVMCEVITGRDGEQRRGEAEPEILTGEIRLGPITGPIDRDPVHLPEQGEAAHEQEQVDNHRRDAEPDERFDGPDADGG